MMDMIIRICPCLKDILKEIIPKKRSIYEPTLEVEEEEELAQKHEEPLDEHIEPPIQPKQPLTPPPSNAYNKYLARKALASQQKNQPQNANKTVEIEQPNEESSLISKDTGMMNTQPQPEQQAVTKEQLSVSKQQAVTEQQKKTALKIRQSQKQQLETSPTNGIDPPVNAPEDNSDEEIKKQQE